MENINELNLKNIFRGKPTTEVLLTPQQEKVLFLIWDKKGINASRLEKDFTMIGYYVPDTERKPFNPLDYGYLVLKYYGSEDNLKKEILDNLGVFTLTDELSNLYVKVSNLGIKKKENKLYIYDCEFTVSPKSKLTFLSAYGRLSRGGPTFSISVEDFIRYTPEEIVKKYVPDSYFTDKIRFNDVVEAVDVWPWEIYLKSTIKTNFESISRRISNKYLIGDSELNWSFVISDFDLGGLNESIIRIKNLISFSDY